MAAINDVIESKVHIALLAVSRFAPVAGAYVFGSQVEGGADEWSDIDLAVFAPGVENWDMHDKAKISVEVQREAGDDVELHLFPAVLLDERDPAGFAAWIIKHGVRVAAAEP